jgi:uncharacterized protein (DUF2147 family)
MKTMLAAFALAVSASAATAQNLTPAGRWHTISDVDGKPRGVIEITESAGVFSGRIAGTLVPGESLDKICEVCPGDRKGAKLLGMTILSGLTQRGEGADVHWSGGEILDPDNGRLYRVTLTLEDEGRTLKVRGYIGVSLFGRTQRWRRAPAEGG